MTLEKEILGGENSVLEFKEARPKDSLRYLKTVVAFANGRGGRIVFGVEDGTRRIVGIPREGVFNLLYAKLSAMQYSIETILSRQAFMWLYMTIGLRCCRLENLLRALP